MDCPLCKNEMIESSLVLKVKQGKKTKHVKVLCMRCKYCKHVVAGREQLEALTQKGLLDDFRAYASLQEKVSSMQLRKLGRVKKDVPKVELFTV